MYAITQVPGLFWELSHSCLEELAVVPQIIDTTRCDFEPMHVITNFFPSFIDLYAM